MYADLTDVDNFNHKHAGTLMFSELFEKWIFVDLVENRVLHYRMANEPGRPDSFPRSQLDLKVKEPRLLKKSPDVQYYNDFHRGEGLYLRRFPRRTMRHTLTLESVNGQYPFWESLPKGLRNELQNTIPVSIDRIASIAWLLNNHRLLSFSEAIQVLDRGEMASVAFSKQFMVSLSPVKANTYLLWYTHVPIGHISRENERVVVDKIFLLQEVKDILRSQNCKWVVVA